MSTPTPDGPIVAELGRPETPEETASRKAEFSRVYRSSQTIRNLIAAVLVTVGMVAVIVLMVPRGERVPSPPIDVAAIAENVESSMQSPALVPELSDFWRVNKAELVGGPTVVWDISIGAAEADARGFLRIAQAFDADSSWAPQRLEGVASSESVRIEGRDWDIYSPGARASGNLTYALGTQVGPDYILLYGALSPEDTAKFAADLSPQLDALEEKQ